MGFLSSPAALRRTRHTCSGRPRAVQATPLPSAPVANALVSSASSPAQHVIYVRALETGIALVVAFIVWRLVEAAIDRFFAQRLLLRHPRASTYVSPLKSITGFLVLVVLALVLLEIWDVNVVPAVWSAGAITAVLAFGAQWVVRDLLAGYSIFAENQFEVGDRIEITTGINSKVVGVVEAIGLRTTRLIDEHGRTVFIPNGNIYVATNLSKGVTRLVLSVTIPWRDTVAAMRKSILDVATTAAAAASIDPERVSVSLEAFDYQQATFGISIRAPRANIDADEGTLRETIAAGLQGKGWLASPSAT
jgi:small-conductance mechanosensitive channel